MKKKDDKIRFDPEDILDMLDDAEFDEDEEENEETQAAQEFALGLIYVLKSLEKDEIKNSSDPQIRKWSENMQSTIEEIISEMAEEYFREGTDNLEITEELLEIFRDYGKCYMDEIYQHRLIRHNYFFPNDFHEEDGNILLH